MATSIVLNSQGRVFIQETKCDKFLYNLDKGVQVAGITESFGDVTYIYTPGVLPNTYEIAGEIEGAETPPTTTITAYMPSDGDSQLLKLAKNKCNFNMQIHYGACLDPTNFNEFDYGFIFQNVKVTSYSTTDLTSRSPDSRSAIDLTFNVSIQKIHELKRGKFTQLPGDTLYGENSSGMVESIYAVPNSDCENNDCQSEYDLIGIQRRLNAQFRFIRRVDNVWYNGTIVSGVTPNTSTQSFIYTNKNRVYAFVNLLSPTTMRVYSSSYSDIKQSNPTWTQVYSSSGFTTPEYHVFGNLLYFIISNGTSSSLGVLNLSTGGIETIAIPFTPTGLWGYQNIIYIGGSGLLYKYDTGVLTNLSSYIPRSGVQYKRVAVMDENNFTVKAGDNFYYCTGDGGKSWKDLGMFGDIITNMYQSPSNPWYVVGVGKFNQNVYESHDGGKTFVENNTFITTLGPTSVTFGDKIYVAAGDTVTGATGGIFETKN